MRILLGSKVFVDDPRPLRGGILRGRNLDWVFKGIRDSGVQFAWGAEQFDGAHGGGVAVFYTELFEQMEDVLLYGVAGGPEDQADFFVAFALGDPEEYFGFPGGQAERLQGQGGRKIRLKFHLIQLGLGSGFVVLLMLQTGVNRCEHFVFADGLGEVIIRSQVHSGPLVQFFTFGRQENEGDGGGGGFGPQGLQHAVAVEFGHHHIAEDEIGHCTSGQFDTAAPVFRPDDIEPFHLKHDQKVFAHLRVVFDDEDSLHLISVRSWLHQRRVIEP